MNKELFKYQDLKYKEFTKKLLMNVDEDKIIGVRIPILKKLAKNNNYISSSSSYFEEVMLEGLSINNSKTIDELIERLDTFIPKIDNWSTCDSTLANLKIAKKYMDDLLEYSKKYINGKEFEKRFLLVLLLDYYVNDKYIKEVIKILKKMRYNNYYEKMAVAWLLSKMYINYKDEVILVLKGKNFNKEIIKMTISKIRDSYRISREDKDIIKREMEYYESTSIH